MGYTALVQGQHKKEDGTMCFGISKALQSATTTTVDADWNNEVEAYLWQEVARKVESFHSGQMKSGTYRLVQILIVRDADSFEQVDQSKLKYIWVARITCHQHATPYKSERFSVTIKQKYVNKTYQEV